MPRNWPKLAVLGAIWDKNVDVIALSLRGFFLPDAVF